MQRPALICIASLGLLSACPGTEPGEEETTTTQTPTTLPDFTTGGSSGSEDPTTTGILPETSSTGASTGEPDLSCDKFMNEIDPVIPRVVLVLDKSGSMVLPGKSNEPGEVGDGFWDHDNDANTPEVTRWSSLHAVVESLFAGLDSVINFGAVLFPSTSAISDYSALACPVDAAPLVPVAAMNGAKILAAIPAAEATNLAGGTPATAGMKVAIEELSSLDTTEPRFIVLITDGAANCREDAANNTERFESYDEQLPVTVTEAAGLGFQTYVIGIDILNVLTPMQTDGNPDNTNTFERLNELAEAGGTARPGDEKFYNASNQIELQAALMEITEAILTCEIPLSEPVPDKFYIQRLEVGPDGDPDQQVYETDAPYEKPVQDCATESGWQYIDPEKRDAIILCGAACEYYKETGVVNIEFGCNIG
jgi:hypothetical protein